MFYTVLLIRFFGCIESGMYRIRGCTDLGLVLKTSGYPDQVALSGYHGNQVNFKISMSKKFLI